MKIAWRQGRVWCAGAFAALAVLYVFPPAEYKFYPRCPFYVYAHLLCPGCGGTRALYELLHLNLREALHYNALLVGLAPVLLSWLGWCCYQAFRYDRFPAVPWPRTLALGLGLISIVFAVARNTGIAFAI